MADDYQGRHRRDDNAPTQWLEYALIRRGWTGSTHRHAAEPEDGEQ